MFLPAGLGSGSATDVQSSGLLSARAQLAGSSIQVWLFSEKRGELRHAVGTVSGGCYSVPSPSFAFAVGTMKGGLAEQLSRWCGAANHGACLANCHENFRRRAYETDDKIFLYVLRLEFSSLWDMAFESGSLIVVPQGISLGPRVALEDVENHILREAQVPGEYYSVNGKKAVIDGSDLCTQEGYTEARRVRIIVSEEVADEVRHPGKRVQVLLVVRPLEGGVRASENPDELDYESLRKYVAILRLNPEVEAVFQEMDDFVREVNFLGDAAADAFERIKPSLSACVHAKWRSACGALAQLDLLHGCGQVKERHRLEVAQVVETYIMGGIHRTVHRWLRTQHAATLHTFATALDRMQGYSAADMGVPPDFDCDVSSAVSELVRLQDPATPLDKLLALKAVTLQLYRVVQEHQRRRAPVASVDAALSTDDLVALIAYSIVALSTDDLVALIAYSIVRAHPQSAGLALDLAYIQDFHFVSTSTSPTGFYLNNFQVAVDYLLSRGEAAPRHEAD